MFFVLFLSGKQLPSYAEMSGIGSKRAAGEPGTSVPPEKKTAVEDSGTTVETIKLGGVSSTVCKMMLRKPAWLLSAVT